MARRTDSPDVDVDVNDEIEDTGVSDETETVAEKPAKEPKQKKEPVRGDLPEGYVTPIGLAKALTERQLHTNREGQIVPVAPQMVYSYIKNAPKEHPFPMETVQDSLGHDRQVVKLDAGIEWWTAKNARAAARKAFAADKATKKAEAAAKKATEPVTEAEAPAVEAVEAE